MLTIRLSRIGKKKKPMYRLVISEKARDPYGRALEILGSYNPFTKELEAKAERIKYWISKGAGMSPTVNNLLLEKKIIEGEKVKASTAKKKKKQKEDQPAGEAGKPGEGEVKKEAPATEEKPAADAKEEKKEEVKEAPAEEDKKEEKPKEEKKEGEEKKE